MEIVAIVLVVLLAILFAFLIYRSARTYDAGSHATFITTKDGEFYGALRSPITLWNPSIKVLKDRHAPDITFITQDAGGQEYFEKSLVNRRTGEISLRVNTCTPRPFISRTIENRQLLINARVTFQLDVDRIQVPTQMQAFGATFGARIVNLFDNAIGEYSNEQVRANQSAIEEKVLRQLQDVEFPSDPAHPPGMPLGVRVYEATFSYEPVSASGVTGDVSHIAKGALALTHDDIDDLLDTLKETKPEVVETLKFMMELQTRQNIVELLCKSGGLVAFTAQELGLSERPLDRKISGINRMAPVAAEPIPSSAPMTAPEAEAVPTDPATAYYSLGAPKRH
ncbi:MAG: hypothetical protein R3C52_08850 [Hyphomonadaceae bacterium]